MKSVLILPLLLLCTFCVYSQSSEFVNSDKLWSVLHENSADHIFPNDPYPFVKTTWYKMGSDTLIGDYNYKQLMISNDSLQMNWMTKGAIRANGQKVYYFDMYSERLLYDFGLQVNDTIALLQNHSYVNYVLDSVGVYYSGHSNLKAFYFSTFRDENPEIKIGEIWYEGIGSLHGLLNQNCNFLTPCNDIYQLLCFSENDSVIYHNQNYNNCFIDSTVLSSKQTKPINNIKIYPNPAKNQATISNPFNIKIKRIELIDFYGRIIEKWEAQDLHGNVLKFEQVLPGIYLLNVETETGITTEKLIVQ
jgi:hypothetical protein